jgi:hypothetical protein
VEIADRRLAEQLGEVASVEALIELREEFESRLKDYFKEEIRNPNILISQEECTSLLDTLKLTYPLSEKYKLELDSLGSNHRSNFGDVIKELMIKLVKTYLT